MNKPRIAPIETPAGRPDLRRCGHCETLERLYLELAGPEVRMRCAGCQGLYLRLRAYEFITWWYEFPATTIRHAPGAIWSAMRRLGIVKGEPDLARWLEAHAS